MAVLASIRVEVTKSQSLAGNARESVWIGEETPQNTRSTFGRLIKKDAFGGGPIRHQFDGEFAVF